MWQRVQTLYLFLAAVLVAALFFSDVITVPGDEELRIAYIDKLPYLVLLVVAAAGQLTALFSFRHRMFQLRIAAATAIILLGLQGWLAYDYFTADKALLFSWTAVFPIVGFILDLMACRGIFSDELIVRSANHLRSAKRK